VGRGAIDIRAPAREVAHLAFLVDDGEHTVPEGGGRDRVAFAHHPHAVLDLVVPRPLATGIDDEIDGRTVAVRGSVASRSNRQLRWREIEPPVPEILVDEEVDRRHRVRAQKGAELHPIDAVEVPAVQQVGGLDGGERKLAAVNRVAVATRIVKLFAGGVAGADNIPGERRVHTPVIRAGHQSPCGLGSLRRRARLAIGVETAPTRGGLKAW
jgi:hypothetical protein